MSENAEKEPKYIGEEVYGVSPAREKELRELSAEFMNKYKAGEISNCAALQGVLSVTEVAEEKQFLSYMAAEYFHGLQDPFAALFGGN